MLEIYENDKKSNNSQRVTRKERNYFSAGKILRKSKVIITFLSAKDLLAPQLTQEAAIGGVL